MFANGTAEKDRNDGANTEIAADFNVKIFPPADNSFTLELERGADDAWVTADSEPLPTGISIADNMLTIPASNLADGKDVSFTLEDQAGNQTIDSLNMKTSVAAPVAALTEDTGFFANDGITKNGEITLTEPGNGRHRPVLARW